MSNYRSCLHVMMSFLDNTEYKDGAAFLSKRLEALTNVDIYWHLANKAYSTPEPDEDDAPTFCRSTTAIQFHKKAISHFMPWRRMVWDEI